MTEKSLGKIDTRGVVPKEFVFRIVHFNVACLWTGMWLRMTLLWYKPCCFSNINYFVIMLTRYWSLSQPLVTFSFTPNHRFGDKVNNCNMAYYSKTVTIRSFLKFSYLLMAKVRVCSPEEKWHVRDFIFIFVDQIRKMRITRGSPTV